MLLQLLQQAKAYAALNERQVGDATQKARARKVQKVEEQFSLLRKASRDFEQSSAVGMQQQALLAYLNNDLTKCHQLLYDLQVLQNSGSRQELKQQCDALRAVLFEEIARCDQEVQALTLKRDSMARPPSMKVFTTYRKYKYAERWIKGKTALDDVSASTLLNVVHLVCNSGSKSCKRRPVRDDE